MHFLPKKLDDYVVAHSEEEPELSEEITEDEEVKNKVIPYVKGSSKTDIKSPGLVNNEKILNPLVLILNVLTVYS